MSRALSLYIRKKLSIFHWSSSASLLVLLLVAFSLLRTAFHARPIARNTTPPAAFAFFDATTAVLAAFLAPAAADAA